MERNFLQQLKENLLQRKQNILKFIKQTAPATVKIRTGHAGDEALGEQLQHLDSALEKVDMGTLGLCEVCNDYVEINRLEMDYTACVCLEHLTGDERTRLENDLNYPKKFNKRCYRIQYLKFVM